MKKINHLRIGWRLLLAILCLTATTAFADVEPNDNIATAEPLALNTLATGDLFVNPTNDANDYYIVTLPANGLVSVTGNYDSELSGFIQIYSASGSYLVGSADGSGEKMVSVNCIAAGTVYIRVYRSSGSGNYSFTVTLDEPANNVDTEPNNSTSTIQDTYLENQTWTGQLGYSGIGGRDSEDYFYIVSPRDGNVVIALGWTENPDLIPLIVKQLIHL